MGRTGRWLGVAKRSIDLGRSALGLAEESYGFIDKNMAEDKHRRTNCDNSHLHVSEISNENDKNLSDTVSQKRLTWH